MNRHLLNHLFPFFGLAFVLVIFSVLIQIFEPSALTTFLSFDNVQAIALQTTIVGIGALGMCMVIISGGIDLSVGSLIALSTVVVATTMNTMGEPSMGSIFLSALAGVLACACVGGINGLLVTRLSLAPFIATLGTMQIARGVAKWIGNNQMIRTPSNDLQNWMDSSQAILGFAPGVWLLLALTLLSIVLLNHTIFGRLVVALGSNEETARLCGVPVRHMRFAIYTLCGAFTGIAGVMQYAFLGSGSPTEAVGKELDIIAAVVIGGGSLSGGEGSALGALLGALIMSVLRSGCVMLGVPSYFQDILIGLIIIAAVALDRFKHSRS